jgi:hypothetical protein
MLLRSLMVLLSQNSTDDFTDCTEKDIIKYFEI